MKKTTRSFKIFIASITFLFLMIAAKSTFACNATFTHTNACAGDTVWFFAQDQMAVYTWDFGDSTSAVNINHDTTTFHVYPVAGTYYVTLFVNIGAEWDYQTQIITVGTDCFHADYDTRCGGSNYIYFNDQSTGNGSLSWDFGDPASGVNNTSSLPAPYHLFPAPGNYNVRLITNNGTTADTSIQIVNVPVNCIDATMLYNINGNCLNDSTAMTVYYTGTITSYSWNFGDPSSGINNTSSASNPKHLYSALGMYNVQLIISDGITTDTIHSIQTIIDCTVWPGDCNRDGEVNADDIFPIGLFYGSTGTARPAATNSFSSQPCTDWPNFFSDFMYLQELINKKYADCNGDMTINNMDMTAINANYGMAHNTHNNISAMPEAGIADPAMSIQFPVSTAGAGAIVTATINLGTSAKPIMNLYGYSFTINYDPALIVPGSVSINLSTNWLGNASNELMLTHDDYANGKIDASVVRFDHVQIINGSGQIGTITFQLKSTATGTLHAFFSTSAKALSTVMFGGGTTSGNQEIFRPINLIADDLLISALGVNENETDNTISVYPNPANSFVNVTITDADVLEFDLTNELGQVVYTSTGHFNKDIQINTAEFAKGIYSLSCRTKDGMIIKKISIIK